MTTILILLGQVTNAATNAPPDLSNAPLPQTNTEFWMLGMAIVVPLLIGGMKKLIPSIPKWALPVSSPFVGLAIGLALKAIGATEAHWIDMAVLGAAGVAVREGFNQIATKNIKGARHMETKDH